MVAGVRCEAGRLSKTGVTGVDVVVIAVGFAGLWSLRTARGLDLETVAFETGGGVGEVCEGAG